ncbi:probable aspartic proteinase GIP2 [Amaranthus tricolor]|uniref:probable aspartic proteinase GIP2 n=1 Tax=Amaranthus tricolor TaxID=29722 RepID=UPI0025881BF7|nr:probable aspartic proteinase GIP2 [Amaranthus tricolor]
MAYYNLSPLLLFSCILLSSQLFQAQSATPPYLLPIVKDSQRLQYYTSFLLGTPPFRVSLTIDLSNPWSWFTCNSVGNNETYYQPYPKSSSFRPIPCSNATCDPYDSHFCADCDFEACGSHKGNMCGGSLYGPSAYTSNPSGSYTVSYLVVDTISIYKSTDKSPVSTTLSNFPFTCGWTDALKGLSHYTKGILSLARKDSSLPGLISKTYNVHQIFALCLPSSSTSGINGAVYFGGGPYFVPSTSFISTPLVRNPVDIGVTIDKGKSSVEYFINVKSIVVEGTPLKINPTLLSINKNGIGGTKLSTINVYSVLHTDIYNALVATFTAKAAAMNITKVDSVSSFTACYSSKNIVGSKTGPKVPVIDLILDGNSKWRIYGANSMIKVSNDVRCLAFKDGGSAVKTSVVIGGKQMEDNLVEFDLESSKLRVTSSLLNFGTSCSQFKGL